MGLHTTVFEKRHIEKYCITSWECVCDDDISVYMKRLSQHFRTSLVAQPNTEKIIIALWCLFIFLWCCISLHRHSKLLNYENVEIYDTVAKETYDLLLLMGGQIKNNNETCLILSRLAIISTSSSQVIKYPAKYG